MMKNCKLSDKKCGPCNRETPPLSRPEVEEYLSMVPGWMLTSDSKIIKTFHFKDFVSAMAFINQMAAIAETENHHPDFFLRDYRYVDVTLTTHAIQGLSENDFIVAAKIDAISM